VQVLNSPAAVSSIYPEKIGLLITHATACIYNKVGRQVNRSKSEDLQNVKSYFKLSRKEFKELKIKYSLIVLSKR